MKTSRKSFEETIRRGRNRSIKAWPVTDENGDDDDDDDVISLYQVWNPERFQRVTFLRPSINCTE